MPAHEWELDPAGFDDVWALRESGRLPERAVWFCSPEPKATATAQLLTETEVGVVDALREHVRESTDWIEDFTGTVGVVPSPSRTCPAYDGWEPLAACRAPRRPRPSGGSSTCTAGEDVVLVGHGTAWTVLVSALTGRPPDLDRWRALAMPDLIVVDDAALG